MTSYIDVSEKIVTKSPKVGPLLIFSISLDMSHKLLYSGHLFSKYTYLLMKSKSRQLNMVATTYFVNYH